MSAPSPQHMQCMEVWGGSQLTSRGVAFGGLDAWVYSKPYGNAQHGGDVYYASSCATGRISRLLLADVSGHGTAVAATAADLRTLMRRFVNRLDQTEFVRLLNQQFSVMSNAGTFATAIVVTFFEPSRRMTICNAGHPRPLIYREAQKKWDFLGHDGKASTTPSNIPLGLLEMSEYEQFDVELEPGDCVLSYTDALMESNDANGEMLGENGVLRIARLLGDMDPAELTAALLREIAERYPENLSDDDVTVLLVRSSGRKLRFSLAEKLGALMRFSRSLLGAINPKAERPPFPDTNLANIGGAIIPALGRRWRARGKASGTRSSAIEWPTMMTNSWLDSALERLRDRRAFLKFLAGSPYIAALGGVSAAAFDTQQAATANGDVIANPKEALDVFDFEEAAHRKVAPGHWAYMASGVDDDGTIRANREGFKHVQLRPRRLFDATKVDTRTELWGTTYKTPIFTCPTGGEKSFHPEGELAVARATKARDTLQVLSTATSTGVEDVCQAHGQPVWYQLYAPSSWAVTEKIVHRVEAAGCPVIALTVDNTTGRNSETYKRMRPKDLSQCVVCHGPGEPPGARKRPMYDGIDMTGVSGTNPAMDWEFVDRLRKLVSVKLLIKGIDGREDARLALEHGFDGVWVSNHGGRSTETLRATIEALPEVVSEVGGRIPVFVDGGFRRGTDVYKALALGATAVGIGRPFLWGLGAFGQAGVDRVLEIMQAEFKLVMGNCGSQNVSKITRDRVATPDWHV